MVFAETLPGMLALTALIAAVIGGAITAVLLITDRNAPMDLGLLHGRTGIFGIALLLLTAYSGGETSLSIKPALIVLILTVAGGATLYYLIRRKGVLSKAVIVIHGSLAVTSLAILLFGLPL